MCKGQLSCFYNNNQHDWTDSYYKYTSVIISNCSMKGNLHLSPLQTVFKGFFVCFTLNSHCREVNIVYFTFLNLEVICMTKSIIYIMALPNKVLRNLHLGSTYTINTGNYELVLVSLVFQYLGVKKWQWLVSEFRCWGICSPSFCQPLTSNETAIIVHFIKWWSVT